MVDDIRPQPEDSKNKNNPEPNTAPPDEPIVEVPEVDSLIKNNSGAIGSESGRKRGKIKKTAHSFLERGLALWPSSKKQKIAGGLIVAVLLIGGSGGIYALMKNLSESPTPTAPVVQKKEEPPKTTEPSRLTGVEIPIELNKRPVTAIMIENSPDARPQSGLKDAGIVFEAIAEGGITRFNALFLESQPDYIGPVRSVRPYYIDFFLPFDAAIVHAGGSAEGLAKIRTLGVKDLDHGANAGAFRRVSQRFAPHNLYTSMAALDAASQARGYTSSQFTSWERKKKETPAQTPSAKSIDVTMSSPLYNSHYDYDAASNTYKRSLGGRPHIDEKSGQQLSPKVIITLVMAYSKNGIYSVYQTSGSGQMYVFQDGQVAQGTWKKGDSKSQFEFLDSAGKKLALNPGQTWVSLVASPDAVKSAP